MRTTGAVSIACICLLCVLRGDASSQQADRFESLLASAQAAQARSDLQAAAQYYEQAVRLRPELAELRANLGLMYYQTGKDEQAREAFRQALRLKPGLFVPNLFLGLEYVKLRRFAEAIPYFKQAAKTRPGDAQVQLGLGQAYAGMGQTRLAAAAYSHATQLDPANADAWYRLGVSYLEQVEADARVLLTRHKDSPHVQLLMAETFAEIRALIQAEDAYKKTLAVSRSIAGAHAGYGLVLLNKHDLAAAEKELMAESALNPGSLVAKLGIARLHLEQGALARAAQEMTEIWTTDTGFFRANVASVNLTLTPAQREELIGALRQSKEAGNLQELAALFRDPASGERTSPAGTAVVSRTPQKAKGSLAEARRLYASGKYGECSELLARVATPLKISELQLLAPCSFLTGRYASAMGAAVKMASNPATETEGLYWETKSAQKLSAEALARASATDPASSKLHVLLGDIYRQQKAFPDAEQEYRKALALRPDDTGALFGLSLALLADGQNDEALNLARTALGRNPQDPELNAVMGEILCAQNDFAGAEPYLRNSLNTKPEFVARVHALLGKVYAETNRTQQAIAELKLGLASDKDGSVHYQIARLYLKVGDRNSAKQAFEASKQMQQQGLMRATVALQQGENDSKSP